MLLLDLVLVNRDQLGEAVYWFHTFAIVSIPGR